MVICGTAVGRLANHLTGQINRSSAARRVLMAARPAAIGPDLLLPAGRDRTDRVLRAQAAVSIPQG
ncbi:MAG: hypothetical protein ACRDPM_23645, partial [Solirubrobacteraceae bacterium]